LSLVVVVVVSFVVVVVVVAAVVVVPVIKILHAIHFWRNGMEECFVSILDLKND